MLMKGYTYTLLKNYTFKFKKNTYLILTVREVDFITNKINLVNHLSKHYKGHPEETAQRQKSHEDRERYCNENDQQKDTIEGIHLPMKVEKSKYTFIQAVNNMAVFTHNLTFERTNGVY